MSEPDFSGIDPLRVPEARRRVEAIRRYLALEAPSSADTTRIASTIGLSRVQFGRLVRAWRDHRDAALLVVGKRGPATRDYGVDTRALAIMQRAIAETGAETTLNALAAEIDQHCMARGIAPPARGTINNHLKKARARGGTAISGPPKIVVGRGWFHLPIVGVPHETMPMVLLAVALPERFILAFDVCLDASEPPHPGELVEKIASRTRASSTRGTRPRGATSNSGARTKPTLTECRSGSTRTWSISRGAKPPLRRNRARPSVRRGRRATAWRRRARTDSVACPSWTVRWRPAASTPRPNASPLAHSGSRPSGPSRRAPVPGKGRHWRNSTTSRA